MSAASLGQPNPADYDHAQEAGKVALSCRAIECFRPYHFDTVGYPTHITSLGELWKYTECMHEGFGLSGPADEYFASTFLQGGFSQREFDEIKSIKSALDDLSNAIGRRVEYPTNSLFLALNQARHITAVAPQGSTVVELGGGAGYLGALLTLRGYRYVATDIAQAFYLLQSQLISRVAPKGCINLAHTEYGVQELQQLQPGQAVLIPWWRWVQPHIPNALAIDLATSNHNLLEMHPFSRLYHLRVLRENFSPNAVGLVFEGWGDPAKSPQWTAVRDLSERGFVLTYNDARITCYAPEGKHEAGTVLRNPLPPPAGPGTPSSAPQQHNVERPLPGLVQRILQPTIENIVGLVQTRLAPHLKALSGRVDSLASRLGAIEGTPRVNPDWGAPEFRDGGNAIAKKIAEFRARERTDLMYRLEDYRALMGGNLASADERFLAFVFQGTSNARPWITAPPD